MLPVQKSFFTALERVKAASSRFVEVMKDRVDIATDFHGIHSGFLKQMGFANTKMTCLNFKFDRMTQKWNSDVMKFKQILLKMQSVFGLAEEVEKLCKRVLTLNSTANPLTTKGD